MDTETMASTGTIDVEDVISKLDILEKISLLAGTKLAHPPILFFYSLFT
jgi:hypothetical protein